MSYVLCIMQTQNAVTCDNHLPVAHLGFGRGEAAVGNLERSSHSPEAKRVWRLRGSRGSKRVRRRLRGSGGLIHWRLRGSHLPEAKTIGKLRPQLPTNFYGFHLKKHFF